MGFTVKRFGELTVQELHDILKTRVDVFVVEQNCPYPEVDGLDPVSLHVFGYGAAGNVNAYARAFEKPGEPEVVQIGRVVATERGRGLGAQVMTEAVRASCELLGAREIYIEAQVYARGFYEKLGFTVCSDEFDEDGIPHIQMRRKLS